MAPIRNWILYCFYFRTCFCIQHYLFDEKVYFHTVTLACYYCLRNIAADNGGILQRKIYATFGIFNWL